MSTATVLLINPKSRGEKGKATTMSHKKSRTPAQIAATKKLVAFNKSSRASSKPAKSAAKPKTKTTTVYKRNPLPPRKQNANVARGKGMFSENLMPAAIGAGGALAFDLVWGKLPLSPSLRTGVLRYPIKLLGALALGVAAEKFLPDHQKHHAITIAQGSMTVLMHEAAVDFLAKNVPSLHLAAYEADQMAEIIELNGFQAMPTFERFETPAVEDLSGMGEALELNGVEAWSDDSQYAESSY